MSFLKKAVKLLNSTKRYSSSLYVTGDKAQTNFVVLTPVIDFEETLNQKNNMLENLNARGLELNFEQIEERWNFYKSMDERKKLLESTKSEIGKRIAELMKQNPQNTEEIERLKIHLKEIKDDYKFVKDMSYSLEETTMLKILDLPNVLHPKTPRGDIEHVVYSHLNNFKTKSESHFKIAQEKGYTKYINPLSCFLKSTAAQCELAVQNYFHSALLNANFIQFSNADFVKSVVVEGCGVNPGDPSKIFTLEDIHCVKNKGLNKLHIVGASSLYSFMAYFTKHSVQSSYLPFRAFSLGRCYQPSSIDVENSFFNLSQTSNVNVFIALKENEDIFDSLLKEIISLYDKLGFHFRLALQPAKILQKSESLRISVEMYSNNLQKYIEVGNVSFYDNYLSKRLLFSYTEHKDRKYPIVVAGSIVNIHKVLGCAIENNSVSGNDLLTNFFKGYVVK